MGLCKKFLAEMASGSLPALRWPRSAPPGTKSSQTKPFAGDPRPGRRILARPGHAGDRSGTGSSTTHGRLRNHPLKVVNHPWMVVSHPWRVVNHP